MEDRELKNIDGNVDEKWEETLEEKLRRSADDVKIPVTLEPKTVTEILRKRRKRETAKICSPFCRSCSGRLRLYSSRDQLGISELWRGYGGRPCRFFGDRRGLIFFGWYIGNSRTGSDRRDGSGRRFGKDRRSV